MQVYEVLVVDDSAFMRRSITQIIERNPKFRVAAIARNGTEAIEKVKRLHPAVVTMDVEMPQMDGLTAVERLMGEFPVPIVMLSSLTDQGTRTAIRALQLGAVDCVHKDKVLQDKTGTFYDEFYEILETAANAKLVKPSSVRRASTPVATRLVPDRRATPVELVLIGCSTGGPAALHAILPSLAQGIDAPILVIQHMPPGFTKTLAERFNGLCGGRVKEAEDGDVLQRGWLYIAPAGTQTIVSRQMDKVTLRLTNSTPVETRFRPSVDVALLSAAPVFRDRLLTVILTGMGNDGTRGCKEVKSNGGRVVVQSEDSCVVYGMPKSVVEAGYADAQVSLDSMAEYVERIVERR